MPKNATPRRHVVPIAQAAEAYGISVRTVRRRISKGHLRGYRMDGGPGILVDLNDMDAMLKVIPTAGTWADDASETGRPTHRHPRNRTHHPKKPGPGNAPDRLASQ